MSQQMTPDDLWVRRLQNRADEVTPDVLTDVDVVVRHGRRRRSARRASAITGTAILALGIALGAAPAMRLVTDDVRPAVLPEDREVVIDTTNGTITLPWDRYFLSETEQAEVFHASALAMHECAAGRGYVYAEPGPVVDAGTSGRPLSIGDLRFGVWWMPSAQSYGYATESTPPAYGAPLLVGPDRTAERVEILDECGRTPTVQQFWPNTELSEPVPDFVELARQTPAGEAVLDDWEACLGTHGLQRDGNGLWGVSDGKRNSGDTRADYGEPLGPDSAVIDARCKADVDLLEKFTQVVADLQAPFIAAHRQELIALRVAHDHALENARTYVAEHG